MIDSSSNNIRVIIIHHNVSFINMIIFMSFLVVIDNQLEHMYVCMYLYACMYV
jgi:hypothetical protein